MRWLWKALAVCVFGTLAAGDAFAQVTISEIRLDEPSTDNSEYFELAGPAGQSLTGLTYLVIGDGSAAAGSGVIEVAVSLSGRSIPADGYFLCAESTFALGGTVDFTTSLNFENDDNFTHLLVSGFTGSNGQDLDTNDDGTLDATPWTAIVDSVALVKVVPGPPGTERVYSATIVGPDGSFVPGHAFRSPEGLWLIGLFAVIDGEDTPGAANAGTIALATIPEIQGDEQFSPFANDLVDTTGVVTARLASGTGFWMQDPAGDGDDATSDGVFVAGSAAVATGDLVRVVGRVQEQQFPPAIPLTRITSVALVDVLSTGNALPDPVELKDLPDETMADGIAFLEPLEGMRVRVEKAPVVAATNGFGEFAVLAKKNAKKGSGFFPKSSQIIVGDCRGGDVDYNPERLLVDDSTLSSPLVVRPHDKFDFLEGVLDFTFGNYKIQPTDWDVDADDLPCGPVSRRHGPKGNVRITTFNVENLFDLVDEPGKDDAGSTPTAEELETKLRKLTRAVVDELLLPEVMIVEETENQTILQVLADRINAEAGTDYVATGLGSSDVRGIEVAFLWDAERVDLVEAFLLSGTDVEDAFGPTSESPGREPLVGVFEIEGKEVTIVANHFKSKGGDDPLFSVSWPPVRSTETQRVLQARVVRDFVNTILDADPKALVMVAGDLNDFAFAEPGEGEHAVGILEGTAGEVPLENLSQEVGEAKRFSFVFDGNSQVLDHMLVSPELRDLFVAADFLHFNTPFPSSLLEDDTTALHCADHDPLEGRFRFGKRPKKEDCWCDED